MGNTNTLREKMKNTNTLRENQHTLRFICCVCVHLFCLCSVRVLRLCAFAEACFFSSGHCDQQVPSHVPGARFRKSLRFIKKHVSHLLLDDIPRHLNRTSTVIGEVPFEAMRHICYIVATDPTLSLVHDDAAQFVGLQIDHQMCIKRNGLVIFGEPSPHGTYRPPLELHHQYPRPPDHRHLPGHACCVVAPHATIVHQ